MPRKTIAVLEKELRGERAKSAELAKRLRELSAERDADVRARVDLIGDIRSTSLKALGLKSTPMDVMTLVEAVCAEVESVKKTSAAGVDEFGAENERLRHENERLREQVLKLDELYIAEVSKVYDLRAELDVQTKRADGLESMWRAEARKVEAFVAVARALEEE